MMHLGLGVMTLTRDLDESEVLSVDAECAIVTNGFRVTGDMFQPIGMALLAAVKRGVNLQQQEVKQNIRNLTKAQKKALDELCRGDAPRPHKALTAKGLVTPAGHVVAYARIAWGELNDEEP